MQVQLLVERDQNECVVKLAGRAYKFKRNECGDIVSDIYDEEHIKWVSDPHHNTSFKMYSIPKKDFIEKTVDEPEGRYGFFRPGDGPAEAAPETAEGRMSNEMPMHEQVGNDAYAPHVGQADTSVEPDRPPYPQKGSKRPPKRSEN